MRSRNVGYAEAKTNLDDVNLLSAVVPDFKLLAVTFDVLCDPHRAHL